MMKCSFFVTLLRGPGIESRPPVSETNVLPLDLLSRLVYFVAICFEVITFFSDDGFFKWLYCFFFKFKQKLLLLCKI